MKPTSFFQKKQPWSRHVGHAGFWLCLILAILLGLKLIDIPDHDQEAFLSGLALLCVGVMILPTLFFKFVPALHKVFTQRLIGVTEVGLVIAMLLSWIGSFGFYRDGFGYDTGIHFFISGMGALIVMILVIAVFPKLINNPVQLFLIVALILMVIGISNEIFEWSVDQIFNSGTYGEVGQPDDTQRDLIANITGIFVGGITGLFIKEKIVLVIE